jgi:hypothetical protein
MPALDDRFWSKVVRSDGCWNWSAAHSRDGYGAFLVGGMARRAHRLAYEDAHGPIPPGLSVLHRCDNRTCVRPSHLYVGTAGDNARDAVSRGRMTAPVIQGPDRAHSKLSPALVRDIRRRWVGGEAASALAREVGVSSSLVRRVVRREIWKAVA